MTRPLPFDAIDYAVTILKGALLVLAIGLLVSALAPLAAQTAPPAFGALNADASCPTGVDPTEDLDGDCLDDDLERSGFDRDLNACTPGTDGCFVTDPTAWSTDGDPYSDFQEATGVNMEATVESPYRHPLVAAAPQIEVVLDGYQYTPTSTITDSQGQSTGTEISATFSVSSTTAVSTTVGAEASLFEGPKVSTETEVSQSLTVGFSATASYNQEVTWETATSTTANEAAVLTLFLRARNTGGGTAKNVRPTLNVYIGGELIGTVRPAVPFPSNLTPGDALSDPVVVENRIVGTDTEEITVSLEQLRRLRRGAPVGIRVVGLEAEVERWNSADSNWSCGTASEPCLWESFQDQIAARTLRLGIDYGFSGDPEADVPARYFGNPFDYRVYTGSPAGSAGYTLRDVLGFLGVAEGSGAAFQINGRPFPSAWLAVSGPQRDRQGRQFLDHWEAWADANDEWPRDLLDMPMPRNAHLALVSPDPVDPFPLAGENLVTGTMRQVLVAVGTKGSIPVVEAEAHLFQHGVETVVPMERLPGSDVWATPDSLVIPVSVGSSYIVLRDYLGKESIVGPGLTPAFPVEAGASANPCAEIASVAYREPRFGGDDRGLVTVFVGGDPDQPATSFCDGDETYYWTPQDHGLDRTASFRGIAVLDARHRVAVGHGVIARSEDGGQSWIEVPLPDNVEPATAFLAVSFREGGTSGAEVGVAVSQSGPIVRTEDGGRTWAAATLSGGRVFLEDVDYAGGNTWFAVGHGHVRRSDDDGETWQDQDVQAVDADGTPISRPGFQTLTAVEFIAEGVGVVGDHRMADGHGRIYATTDGGATWRETAGRGTAEAPALIPHHDIAYNGRDGWVVVGDDRIEFREDLLAPTEGVESLVSEGRFWAVDFATPEIGFAVMRGGAVFRTEDGGLTWQRASEYPSGPQEGTQTMLDIDMLDANVGAVVGTGDALGATDSGGGVPAYTTVNPIDTEVAPEADLPPGITLAAPAPNPFRATTRVRYRLDAPGRVRLGVHDALGREVAVLVDDAVAAGDHEATFDASGLAVGVYVIRLVGDRAAAARTVTVVR